MSNNHPLFPVTMDTIWQQDHHFQLSQTLRSWLIEPDSLTARLKAHSKTFVVQVLGQSIMACRPQEANSDIEAGEDVLVREVLLLCDGIPHVFARSLLPLNSLTGEQEKLAHLGEQSLGQVLFNHPELIRKNIEVANFNDNKAINALIQELKLDQIKDIWGRRSVFVIDNKPMVVAEVFLPNAHAYQKSVVMS